MQSSPSSFRRRMWLVYPLWLGVCAALFLITRDWPDPSRRTDRISNDQASARATDILRSLDNGRYSKYEVVNISFARRGEVGEEPRWLVLCDEDQRTMLASAIVIELRAVDGAFLRARRLPGHSRSGEL